MMNSPRSTILPMPLAFDTAVVDLGKLLHDTGSSVEKILSSFCAASTKPSGPKVSDMRTSLSIGITPTLNRVRTSPADAQRLVHNEEAFEHRQFHTPANKFSQHQRDVQNWFVQAHPEYNAGYGKASFGLYALGFNEEGTCSDENGLKVLLEEIKKTICDWSRRQTLLAQHKVGSIRKMAHGGTPVSFVPGLPNGGPLPFGFNKEQKMKALVTPGVQEALVQQTDKAADETVRVLPQQDKEAEQSAIKSELEKSARLDKVMDHITSQLLQSDDKGVHTSDREQTPAAKSQNPSVEERAAQIPPGGRTGGRASQATTAAMEGNAASSPTTEAVTPSTNNFVTPTEKDQAGTELPPTKGKRPSSAAKNNDKTLSFPRTVEVIRSPDWLPEGWITEVKTRRSGNSAGSKDKYYTDPVSKHRFRSRKEVIAYLMHGKPKLMSDSAETSPIKKLLEPKLPPSRQKKSHKKVKPNGSNKPNSSELPPSMVPSMTPPGLVGNMVMPPYRTGQPSEWLVYEGLANLPFPMLDPFYYADFGANKSSTSKGSHTPTRPWFFTGPETSWNPFMDRSNLGKTADKSRDYCSYFSMLPSPSDSAPKPSATGSKKSSKRKSADV